MSYNLPRCNACYKVVAVGDAAEDGYCETCAEKRAKRFSAFRQLPVLGGTENTILVWRFQDAPEIYREMSDNGGDEDWIALIPPALTNPIPYWFDRMSGGSSVQEYEISRGYKILISSHA